MIEVEHLTKYYGTTPVVRDVTFNVESGEILGFLGPNGAGKTTTMRMITGYLPPTAGTVRVAGFDVVEKSLEARSHLGYLPETVPLYTELTTAEYLDFRGRISGLHNTRERRARMLEVTDMLNISDVANKLIGNLSRGYRQRVGLAQALLHNPDVLILDEPTVGLDPVQISDVRALIKELGRNHTVILSTHLLPEVSMVCDRVIIINRGRLVALDTPIHLAQGVGQSQTIQLEVGGQPSAILMALKATAGIQNARLTASPTGSVDSAVDKLNPGIYTYQVESNSDADLRADLATAVVGGGFRLLELKSVTPSLEDVFISVISQEEPEDLYEEPLEEEAGYDDEYEEADEAAMVDEDEVVEAAPAREKVVTKKRVRR